MAPGEVKLQEGASHHVRSLSKLSWEPERGGPVSFWKHRRRQETTQMAQNETFRISQNELFELELASGEPLGELPVPLGCPWATLGDFEVRPKF